MSRSATRRADEVSLASLESIASLDQRPSGEVLHDVTFDVAAGQTVALVGRSGGGQDDDDPPDRAAL